jgi:hypothetical protein
LLQSDAFDFIALAIGIAATLRPAASVLYPTRRLPRICGMYNWLALMFSALVIGVMHVAIFSLLDHQSWYTGGNGDDAQVMPCLVLLTMQCIQALPGHAVVCHAGKRCEVWNHAETRCIAHCFGIVSQLVVATSIMRSQHPSSTSNMRSVFT